MTSPNFNIADESTWPVILSVDEIAAIYRRTVAAVKKACCDRRFVPAPCEYRPLRWRKADVVRHVSGGRATGQLRAS